jgi:hypothetical protein
MILYMLNSIHSEAGPIWVLSLLLEHRSAVNSGRVTDENRTTRKNIVTRSSSSRRRRRLRAAVRDMSSVLRAIATGITGLMCSFDMSWDRTTTTCRRLTVLVK